MSAKDAVYRLAHAYPGGIAALAARMGMSPNTLQHKVNPHAEGHHTYIEDAEAMTAFSQDPQVAQALALACGHVCMPVASGKHGELATEVAHAGKEFGDVMQATFAAIEDGRVTAREVANFDKEFAELLVAAVSLRSKLLSLVPKSESGLKVAK